MKIRTIELILVLAVACFSCLPLAMAADLDAVSDLVWQAYLRGVKDDAVRQQRRLMAQRLPCAVGRQDRQGFTDKCGGIIHQAINQYFEIVDDTGLKQSIDQHAITGGVPQVVLLTGWIYKQGLPLAAGLA